MLRDETKDNLIYVIGEARKTIGQVDDLLDSTYPLTPFGEDELIRLVTEAGHLITTAKWHAYESRRIKNTVG